MGLIFGYFGEGEPPEFYRFPEIEEITDADVSVHRHLVPCSYFQRVENDLDEVHVHFVHAISTNRAGLDEMPEINVRETAYGIRREGKRTGSGANISRIAHFMMPNINLVDLPPTPGYPYWTVHVAWRVPIDDESSMTHSLRLKRREPGAAPEAKKAEGAEGKEAHAARGKTSNDPSPTELTEEVLAGRLRIVDIDRDYPSLFAVEDNVALAGQGRLTDRSKDNLCASDKGVILLRQIWERELRALDEGKPLTRWQRPAGHLDLAVAGIKEVAF
jgi:5,5'-dehydrodivanillate O-demethylase